MTVLNTLKFHYNYAKQYGDTDIQITYWNKIQDYIAQEVYGEFGYDTCSMVEREEILEKTIKLLNN